MTNVNAGTLSVLLATGAGTFATAVTYPTDPRPRGMDAADLDGDGVPDVVCATGYPDGDSLLTVYRGLGNGSLQILDHLRLPYRAADCVIADMNGDGRRDIVTTGPLAGMITVLLNQGTVSVTDVGRPGLALDLTIQPMPARSAMTLRFRAPSGVGASLEIFDLAGRRVATLGNFAGGTELRSATWEGRRSTGERAQPGVYFARLTSGSHVIAKPVVLLTP